VRAQAEQRHLLTQDNRAAIIPETAQRLLPQISGVATMDRELIVDRMKGVVFQTTAETAIREE